MAASALAFFIFLPCILASSSYKDVNVENPILELHPEPIVGSFSFYGAKDILCERIRVEGFSRFKINSYASSVQVTLRPSGLMHERDHRKIEVCFHRNATTGLCECAKVKWETLQNGAWSRVMSPFGDRFLDVKFADGLRGSITVLVVEEIHHWRLISLVLGFTLLLLAPFVSKWVPFYYSSSMALGVLLVLLVIMFQGMKLLPTGRKNFFYLTVYGSVLGAGSYIVQHFSMLVNSILVNFGLNEDMHNPVSVFLLVGIFLCGAALGHWIVRKFVLSEDGTVDVSIAQFVKWAMRLVATVFIFESTLDFILAVVTLFLCWCTCSVITGMVLRISRVRIHYLNRKVVKHSAVQAFTHHKRAEIQKNSLNRSLVEAKPLKKSTYHYAWSTTPRKDMLSSYPDSMTQGQVYYSSFHKIPNRKTFSEEEWDKFTSSSTREALAALASSPEFTDWLTDQADRISLLDNESSEDDTSSGSDSEEETDMEDETGSGFFKWF